MMNISKLTPWFLFLCLILLSDYKVRGSISPSSQKPREGGIFGFKPKTLFVFGDSFADTGNTPAMIAASWKFPNGITFPGRPTGRFTDGRVSTDYLAKYIGLRTPCAYKWGRFGRPRHAVKRGMNFAFGGAGVFDTIFKIVPNASVQIDSLEQLIRRKVYSSADLNSSVAFFSIVGNDYLTYNRRNGSEQGRRALIRRAVKQILLDVKRIKDLGVRKVLVALSPPQKCLPKLATPKGGCDTNDTSTYLHNSLLREGLIKLNDKKINSNDNSFLVFDLYNAFVTIFKNKGVPGVSTFPEPLKACCPTERGKSCGDVGIHGEKLFTLCKDPKSFFFWDNVHITDQAWRSVFFLLLPGSQF
ncbi:PREDICTED: GDSL esterase/lipase At2g36325-like [Camelina sativa]|uniref:GDSL esterase/lipase At2g36325-like n=1 Tax=Camelina sativa TaxID=90675 RepID=A0ABM0YSB5_CAMSA|nr:PREDICTED: GDSL esterase/lipase At2g36325-like [Camelina sativa]